MNSICRPIDQAERMAHAIAGGDLTDQNINTAGHDETARLLDITDKSAQGFADYMVTMGRGQGDDTVCLARDGVIVVRQTGWKLMREAGAYHPALFDAWNELWDGALSIHNRHLRLKVISRMDHGDAAFEWEIETRRKPQFP